MLTYAQLMRPTTLDEAYTIISKHKMATMFAGGCWLRLGNRRYPMIVDLSGLGLNYIREDEKYFFIGAMATQESVVRYEGLKGFRCDVLQNVLKCILGVQFRNCATMGGSIAGKFGFSDIIPVLLAMRTEVVLHEAGIMLLEEYLQKSFRDILVEIRIPKSDSPIACEALRKSVSDFPYLTGAISKDQNGWHVFVGCRPGVAVNIREAEILLNDKGAEAASEAGAVTADVVLWQTNSHATALYRREMSKKMVCRMVKEVSQWKSI